MLVDRRIGESSIHFTPGHERQSTHTFTSTTTHTHRTTGPTTGSRSPADEVASVSYSDGKTHSLKYEYDGDGNLTRMEDATGTTTYTYDQLGRLTQAEDGHGNTSSYEYDLANQQTKITYPNGKSITQSFDHAGRLEKITDWLEHTTKFSYDADSNLTATAFPSGTGDEDTYKYDNADVPAETKMTKGAETLGSLKYTTDVNNSLTNTKTTGLPGAAETKNTYDKNSRLTKSGTSSYEYDAANNPTLVSGGSNTYDAASELEKGTGVSYVYDELGGRTQRTPTSGPATTYTYDQAGQLTAITRPKEGETSAIEDSYSSNGQGLRTTQSISGITSYLAWNPTTELPLILNDGTNGFIYGPRTMPLEQINNSTGTTTYLHHDQAGSTRLITGSTGKVEGKCSYSAYGTPTCEGTATTPLGYDGQYTTNDTGLVYMRARVYDPATAQFLSRDPLVSLTRESYSYAQDDPLNEDDPTGLGNWLGLGIPSPGEVAGEVAGEVGHALFPGGGSTQVCLGGTVSLGLTVSLEACYLQTPHGNGIGITGTVGFGGGAAINGHLGIGQSNACHPSEYGGLFSQGGGSAQFGTGGYYNRFSNVPYNEFSGARRVEGWTTGGSVGLGADGGGGVSDTWVIPVGGGGSGSSPCGCS